MLAPIFFFFCVTVLCFDNDLQILPAFDGWWLMAAAMLFREGRWKAGGIMAREGRWPAYIHCRVLCIPTRRQ